MNLATKSSWVTRAITAAVFMVLLRTRINPGLLILCAALVGLFAFGIK